MMPESIFSWAQLKRFLDPDLQYFCCLQPTTREKDRKKLRERIENINKVNDGDQPSTANGSAEGWPEAKAYRLLKSLFTNSCRDFQQAWFDRNF